MASPGNVPFCKPVFLPDHGDLLVASLATGHMSGNGPYTKKCEKLLETQLKSSVRLVSSATHALEMMALLADIQPGDEVIVPSFTFVSTANAFALRGARIRFADNDQFGNILPSEVERLITKRTKVVVAVDYAGASADLDQLQEICLANNIYLFEDAAQAIGGLYKDRALGSVADLGCFSFHETKNIACGEGGALVLRNNKLLDRAEILREKGTDRTKFFQGLVDKYTWVDLGSSYLMSDLGAVYLFPQIEHLEEITAKRGTLWENYRRALSNELNTQGIQILDTPRYNTPNFHLFGMLFQGLEQRSRFITHMKARSIAAPFHYVSLHLSPFGSRYHSQGDQELPGCEKFSNCLARLPLFFNMTEEEQAYVIEEVRAWCRSL